MLRDCQVWVPVPAMDRALVVRKIAVEMPVMHNVRLFWLLPGRGQRSWLYGMQGNIVSQSPVSNLWPLKMLIHSRRATWSRDVDLFRAGAADADQLEALMAAIAIQSQSLWVGEYDQLPVAFIWVVLDDLQLCLARLFVLPEFAQCGVIASLLARLYEQFGDRAEKILVQAGDIKGINDDTLRAVGFEKTGANCWELPLALDGEMSCHGQASQ